MERKIKVPISTIKPGMILAHDIFSEEGKVLLARDLHLTPEHIANLRQRGIEFVEIVSSIRREVNDCQGDYQAEEREFKEFYDDTLDKIKQLFETTYLNRISVNLVNKLANDRIRPLLDAHRAINFLYKIRVHCDYTFRHSINVAIISGIIGKAIGLKQSQLSAVVMAGLLHDIGKLSIAKEILDKPGKLTEQEMTTIKNHTCKGYELLNSRNFTEEIKLGVLQHHERIDGSGYPQGLGQDRIGLYAKVVAVADIYDAMTTDRAYREKVTPFCAADTIARQMYSQLDPEICMAFFKSMHASLSKSSVVLSNGKKGEVIYLHHVFPQRPVIILADGSCLDLNERSDIDIVDIANIQ